MTTTPNNAGSATGLDLAALEQLARRVKAVAAIKSFDDVEPCAEAWGAFRTACEPDTVLRLIALARATPPHPDLTTLQAIADRVDARGLFNASCDIREWIEKAKAATPQHPDREKLRELAEAYRYAPLVHKTGERSHTDIALDAIVAFASTARPTDDHLWDATLRDRDHNAEWADKLAGAIAIHFGVDIGEHSNMNCPWNEALDAIESAPPADAATPQHSVTEQADRIGNTDHVGRNLEGMPQPYSGAVVLLETIAECGARPFIGDERTPMSKLCTQFANDLREAGRRTLASTAATQPEQASVDTLELPPLPDHMLRFTSLFGKAGDPYYTARQMREYARAALAIPASIAPDVHVGGNTGDGVLIIPASTAASEQGKACICHQSEFCPFCANRAASEQQAGADERALFEQNWPEIHSHGIDSGWRGVAWAAWQAALTHRATTAPGPLTDAQIIAALHAEGIDTYPSKFGFEAVQVSATSVPNLRNVIEQLAAAPAVATTAADQQGDESVSQYQQNVLELAEELRLARAQLAQQGAAQAQAGERYTCIGKGGEYELIGTAHGAGFSRGVLAIIYREVATGVMYHRTPDDFGKRMERAAMAAPATSGGKA